jgi:hypothetical protein
MKRINIALAVLAAALLFSCTQEKSFNDKTIGKNDIVFSLQGAPATRSMEEMATVQKGVSIELVADEDGNSVYLEETIEDLNRAWAPVTRGTPAYTENVGVLYKNKMGVYAASLGDASYESLDNEMVGGGWRYNHTYASDPWANGALDFYFRMPTDMTSHGVTLGTNAYGKSDGKLTITFGYESPTTAAEQQDIIFAARNVSEDQYTTSLPNGVPVLFNHALAAVKFAIANPEEAAITSVSFTGLVGKGTCVITPASESNYRDDTGTYSSADAVSWTLDNTATGETYSSGDFGDPVSYSSGSFANNGKYPSSFAGDGAAKTNNLNDADGTQTFWFIPQAMTDNVMLHITYTYGENSGEGDIEFGKALANVTWEAGQLRTYTIRVDEVNVKIEDSVTIGEGDTTTFEDDHHDVHTIYGGTKSGIQITNTGNTDAFIRVAITGQWVDADGAPVFSFTDFTQEDIILEIDSWYNDQFGTGNGHFGVFVGLPGYTKNGQNGEGNDGWVKGNDGYYYYTTKVASGATTGTAPFTSYTVTLANVPKIKVAGELQDVHFVMDVSAQAISAKTPTGGDYAWNKAWENALDYDPSATN